MKAAFQQILPSPPKLSCQSHQPLQHKITSPKPPSFPWIIASISSPFRSHFQSQRVCAASSPLTSCPNESGTTSTQMAPFADGTEFDLSRLIAYSEQRAKVRTMLARTCLERSARGRFTLFRKLPLELRLIIWKFTFKARTIRLHLVKIEHAGQGPLWKCVIAGDRDPVALFVCHESRELALKTYETFITQNLTACPQPPNYELKLVGFPSMRINFDIDKIILSRASPNHPPAIDMIATEKVKNLGVDLNLHGTTIIDALNLSRLLKDWPNLKSLQFIFGSGSTNKGLTEALKTGVALPLVPFDSNLEDYLAHAQQKQGRARNQPINNMDSLHDVFSTGETIKRGFWNFMRDNVAPHQWTGLVFDTAFQASWTTEAPTFKAHIAGVRTPRLVAECSCMILNRDQLPPHLQGLFSENRFPATFWRKWQIGGSDGEIGSRYDGIERLFGEMKID